MRELQLPEVGARIRWIDIAGDGPARVFVHGLGCTGGSDFAHIAAHPLLAGRRSILVDLLGHGLSDRPGKFDYGLESQARCVAAVLDHLGLDGVELVGHSMGGAIAILLAAERPDLVARLVVAEPNVLPGGGPGSRSIAAMDEKTFVSNGFRRMAMLIDRPDFVARFRLADPVALHRSAVALIELTTPTTGELLAGLDIPRAFLVGALSRDDEDDAERIATDAGIPVHVIADAGHNLMIDNPDGFAEALAAALRD
ncbi:pimeloyl-ACP methyl ester carboxylesterase [Herbihabitans rhizosphaerae]|uniref:Pimeloyl-ACP methyl ester carboxylesterase n=1 Tax=Herbihabitans rhizosphaerae TaxID=1872711 RepID=A0A4Q7KRA4_9PSEU|nr:alpha/beta hydrolase [Herbihabitans rhizosphaerae]RZS39085.1 pimeloyl-ACP methyl ester carboxylesterase [Herbihabitans rhizosphaerae]